MLEMLTLRRCAFGLLTVALAFFLGRFTAPGRPATNVVSRAAPISGKDAESQKTGEDAPGSTGRPDPGSDAPTVSSVAKWRAALAARAPSRRREEEQLEMLKAWAGIDPLAALEYTRQKLTRDSQPEAFQIVFTAWAQKDPLAAWEWVKTNEPGEHSHVRAVLAEASRNDPSLGARFAGEMAQDHPDAAAELYIYALDGLLHDGKFDAAKTMLAGARVPGDEQRNALLNFIAGQWARYQPDEAAPWVLSLPAGPVRDQALDAVGQAWSDIDPVKAAEFAVKLPSGTVRQTALRQAISKWAMEDPALASKWVLQYDADKDFDQAVASIATSNDLIRRDIGLALNWAGTIQDPALRSESTSVVVSNWYAQDPGAALNYIKTSPDLTPGARQHLLTTLVPLPLQYLQPGKL